MTYSEKLKDPRWQIKRLDIISRDRGCCRICGTDKGLLDVHHRYYLPNTEPWEYPESALVTYCRTCHSVETENIKTANKEFLDSFYTSGFLAENLRKLASAFRDISVDPNDTNCELLMSKIYSDIVRRCADHSPNIEYFNGIKKDFNE